MEEHPPGFRFYPTEEELISFYLHNKLQGKRNEINRVIPVVDIYELEPWHLPKLAGACCHGDTEQWFFFTPRQEREARGGKPNRITATGYWKATGSPSHVYSSDNRVIGVKKTMVFYKGKAPTGRKTKWKMNEYRAIEQEATTSCGLVVPKLRLELTLCRVYVVSGSFRAFDRRPLVSEIRETVTHNVVCGHEDVTSSQNNSIAEKMSSPDSSYSGENHVELGETTYAQGSCHYRVRRESDLHILTSTCEEAISLSRVKEDVINEETTNCDDDMVNDLEPLWEWEQLWRQL